MSLAGIGSRGGRVVVRASWMFDGTSSRLLPEPMLVLEGSRIVSVDHGVAPPADADVIDLDGATLLPGLVDTHVHLAFDASDDPVSSLARRSDDEVVAAMTDAARTAARGGVTTVRDLGDRDYLSLRLADVAGLPTVVCAGPPITIPGGHCHYLGGVVSRGPDGVRAAVREHVEHGVGVIKVMASGGLLTPGTREDRAQFTRDELHAAVDEAHRWGLPVTAHVHGTEAIVDSIAAGMDGLEHVTFWGEQGIDDAPAGVVADIVDRRITVGATAGFAPADSELEPAAAQRLPLIIANMVKLLQAGAEIVAATDAGVHPTKPHDVLRYGVEQLVLVGMPPLQALHSATSIGARVCGLGDRKGRLAAGYDADLLAVDGDPLTDPAALHQIRSVWVRGIAVR